MPFTTSAVDKIIFGTFRFGQPALNLHPSPSGDCTDITALFESGTISPATPFVNDQLYTFTCNSGYRLDGQEKISCHNDNWQHARPTCSAIVDACGTEHWGKAYADFSGPYVKGDKVHVYCSSGYTNTGTGIYTEFLL